MTACWIAFEGGEGCGKSTQARLLADALGAVLTREPGGTSFGATVREWLLGSGAGQIDARAEALLMAADRAQHVSEVVRPALARGQHVVSDRSAFSSLAYQGWGRGLEVDELIRLSDWASAGRWPDLVVLLDVPPADAATRRAETGTLPDRLEAEGDGFHDRVRTGFAVLAASEPGRWVVVDGKGTVDEVRARVGSAWSGWRRPPSDDSGTGRPRRPVA
jgi:dTMP kinase